MTWLHIVLIAVIVAVDASTADLDATAHTKATLQLFEELTLNQEVLIGQDLGVGNEIVDGYETYVGSLKEKTGGQTIALIGGDLEPWPGLGPLNIGRLVDFLESKQNNNDQGSHMVQLTWHFSNPWTGGDAWDTSGVEDLWDLLDDSTAVYDVWEQQKQDLLNVFSPLAQVGVTVLYRPLHEMNGDWFWYGYPQQSSSSHAQTYQALWKDLFTFLTVDHSLHNILWVYGTASTWERRLLDYYPGSEHVDLVGISVYNSNVETYFTERDYQDLQSLNKPMGLTEFGPTFYNNPEVASGTYDYLRLIDGIRAHWPAVCFAYVWHDWTNVKVSLVSNQNVDLLLGRDDVVTLEEIDTTPRPEGTTPSPASASSNDSHPAAATSKSPSPGPSIEEDDDELVEIITSSSPSTITLAPTSLPEQLPDKGVEVAVAIRNRWTTGQLAVVGDGIGTLVQLLNDDEQLSRSYWVLESAEDEEGVESGAVRLKSYTNGQWMYLNANGVENEASVFTMQKQEIWWSMIWYLEEVVGGNVVWIRNAWSGRYLVASADGNSEPTGEVQLSDFDPNWWSMQWVLVE